MVDCDKVLLFTFQTKQSPVETSNNNEIASEESAAAETTKESANEQSADSPRSETESASESDEQSDQLEAYRKHLLESSAVDDSANTDTENNTDLETTDSEKAEITDSDAALPSLLYKTPPLHGSDSTSFDTDSLEAAESPQRFEFLDSTLNSTFSDSMRGDESLVSAVLGVMSSSSVAHDRSQSIDSNDVVTIMTSQSTSSDDVTMTEEVVAKGEKDGGKMTLPVVQQQNAVVMRSPASNSRRRGKEL